MIRVRRRRRRLGDDFSPCEFNEVVEGGFDGWPFFSRSNVPGPDLRTERPTGGLLDAPYKYSRHGQSGLPISELLPHTAKFADDLCVLRSLYTDNPNHGPALLLMNNGTMTPKVPSMGA